MIAYETARALWLAIVAAGVLYIAALMSGVVS